MITVRTSPQYVNRVRQDWTANGGVYGDGGIYAVVSSNDPFAQTGPTFDLVFAGTATDPLNATTTTDDTLALNFVAQAYQIAAQYVVWSDYQINYALLPNAILSASLNIEPQKALFKDTLIGGRPLGDITNDGSVTSADSLAYVRFNSAPWLNTVAENDYIRTVLNPYMLANPGLYAVYLSPGPLAAKTFADVITFTRASTGTYFDSAGTLTTAAINEPRFDYNPATLAAQGLLIEEQRTNSIRNNTMVDAVAGTPGTLPTNWTIAGAGTGTLTREIVGTGVVNGITYIDIKFTGTISTASFIIACEPNTGGPAASASQTWTSSNYVAIVGGNTTNITAIRAVSVTARTSAGAAVAADSFDSGDNKASLTSTLQRFSASRTLTDGTTAALQPGLAIVLGTGTIGDPTNGITLRIGMPQLEQGAFATSVIPTTTTALTRSADVASVNTLAPWYNATQSTIFAEFQSTITSTASVVNSFNDSTSSNRFTTFVTSVQFLAGRNTGGAGVLFTPVTANAPTVNVNKVALAVANLDVAICGNGGTVATATTYNVPTVTQLQLGNQFSASYLNGYLRRITYYPRRLANADLQTITT